MSVSSDPRTILVTGCSSGFGLLSALAFARRGDSVYATVRSEAGRKALADAAADEGVEVRPLLLDVTDPHETENAVGKILAQHDAIDVLVNNAGVACSGSVEMIPMETLRTVFDTNFFAPVRLIRHVLPGMRAQRRGHLINVSSMSGRLPAQPITWSYDTTKHALGALSEALAQEVAPFGIVVRCIEPAFFRTDILRKKYREVQETGRVENSPYASTECAVDSWIADQVAKAADPTPVIEAIVQASDEVEPWPVHVPVGEKVDEELAELARLDEVQYALILMQQFGL
jgi:NAD(P)-dependent dehydrogenase (short-subunit alcohol dehydrogenase family)